MATDTNKEMRRKFELNARRRRKAWDDLNASRAELRYLVRRYRPTVTVTDMARLSQTSRETVHKLLRGAK
jgi:hypothetical protein